VVQELQDTTSRFMAAARPLAAVGSMRRSGSGHKAAAHRDPTLNIRVCHFPPGTSKWNKIEHRLCFITMNWRSRPLISHEVIVHPHFCWPC